MRGEGRDNTTQITKLILEDSPLCYPAVHLFVTLPVCLERREEEGRGGGERGGGGRMRGR